MWVYEAYDRIIEATFELSPLADVRATAAASDEHDRRTVDPDLRVVREDLPATPEAVDASLARVYENPDGALTAYRTGETVFWFADGAGTLRVDRGERIAASARPGADEEALADLVAGPGLRTAFRLQGDVVVHASAVAVDGRAAAFLGPSGRGKSTAAAACHAAGHEVLADDAIPIRVRDRDGRPEVPPGAPRLDVDRRARDALGLAGDEPVVARDAARRTVRPLAALYLLDDGSEFAIEPVSPRRATFALLRAADGLYEDGDAAALMAHQEAAAGVVEAVPVKRLVRPRSLDRLSDLPAVVADDLARGDERAATPR